ncbi:MAG: ATP synthase F1 subunit gamma [Endomicrobiales bacterium]|nr:ATP synthase F1 subunit gamma [Endomicrobiales bacterium]
MSNLRELRRRIKSVKSIKHITSAMQKISASRLMRAKKRFLNAKPYAGVILEMLSSVMAECGDVSVHSLLETNTGNQYLLFVISADKGLCGAFNSSLLRKVDNFLKEKNTQGGEVSLVCFGKKAVDHFKRNKQKLLLEYQNTPVFPKFPYISTIADELIERYTKKEFAGVYVAYNKFISSYKQVSAITKLLPLDVPKASLQASNYIYEPSAQVLFGELLSARVRAFIWSVILESSIGEHSARMIMMEQASVNASRMIDTLVLDSNKLRQSIITKELTEIVGTSEALK